MTTTFSTPIRLSPAEAGYLIDLLDIDDGENSDWHGDLDLSRLKEVLAIAAA